MHLFYYSALYSILYTKDIIEHGLRYEYDGGTKKLNYSWALKDWTLKLSRHRQFSLTDFYQIIM